MPYTLNRQDAQYVLTLLVNVNSEDFDGWEHGLAARLMQHHPELAEQASEFIVGQELPQQDSKHATYIGPWDNLRGKTALVSPVICRSTDLTTLATEYVVDHVVAQFDDTATGYGFGWHRFDKDDFEIVEAVPLLNQTELCELMRAAGREFINLNRPTVREQRAAIDKLLNEGYVYHDMDEEMRRRYLTTKGEAYLAEHAPT